jgi:N-acetylglutamate synthase-like GNAT family acetyltransferase
MQSFNIRKASEEDIHGILACLCAAFAPYKDDYTAAAYEDTVLTRDRLSERMQTMTVFVAVTDSGQAVGTIASAVLGNVEGHLRGMAVDPGWHGRGVAGQLLQRAEAELRAAKCSHVTLDTTEYLKRAIHFYERNGYRATGKVTDFFGMPLYEYMKQIE